jgi:hypothetical protein
MQLKQNRCPRNSRWQRYFDIKYEIGQSRPAERRVVRDGERVRAGKGWSALAESLQIKD